MLALTTAGVADALGAIPATKAWPVEDLEEACHAAQLLFQRLGVVRQGFQKVCRHGHCSAVALSPRSFPCALIFQRFFSSPKKK